MNPRRGSQDKAPWRNLDLTAIMEQTVESSHVYDVYLGETVVPYATLEPLQAYFCRCDEGEHEIAERILMGPAAYGSAGLERRMRGPLADYQPALWEDE